MSQASARYQRSPTSLIAAMVVTLGVVLLFVGFRALNRDNRTTPVRTVEWTSAVKAARGDGQLAVVAPSELPQGWRATSVTYVRGGQPRWHLGVLTNAESYIGIEESTASARSLVEKYVDPNATSLGPVRVSGSDLDWAGWKDSGGDYALVASLPADRSPAANDTVLVVGSTSSDQVKAMVTLLTTG